MGNSGKNLVGTSSRNIHCDTCGTVTFHLVDIVTNTHEIHECTYCKRTIEHMNGSTKVRFEGNPNSYTACHSAA